MIRNIKIKWFGSLEVREGIFGVGIYLLLIIREGLREIVIYKREFEESREGLRNVD